MTFDTDCDCRKRAVTVVGIEVGEFEKNQMMIVNGTMHRLDWESLYSSLW